VNAKRRGPAKPGADKLLVGSLAERIARIEARLAPVEASDPEQASDKALAKVARAVLRARNRRQRYFDAEMFADPAWDMLLDLFVSTATGKRVNTTSLCIAGQVPGSTGLRWIAVLEKHELIVRVPAPDDARVKLVELTRKGYRLMRQFLIEGVTKRDLPDLI
jgi:hypothetical protein